MAVPLVESGVADASLLASIKEDERALEQLAQDHYVDRIISRQEFLTLGMP